MVLTVFGKNSKKSLMGVQQKKNTSISAASTTRFIVKITELYRKHDRMVISRARDENL